MSTLELTGLKGHSALGFLAACGLLRAAIHTIETRLGWSKTHTNGCYVAQICVPTLGQSQIRTKLVEIIANAAVEYTQCLQQYRLSEAEALLDDYRENGRIIIESAGEKMSSAEFAVAFLPAIGSDISTRQKTSGKKKGKTVIRNSHLLMTSGQQDLLKKKGRRPASKLAKRSRKGAIPDGVREKIEETLFGSWKYEDDDHPLGWDPQFQRLHALRNKAPKSDKSRRSVYASIFLASQALPLFPCFTVGGRLQTTGFRRDGRDDWFAWPIWRDAISHDALRVLLTHPFNKDLRIHGVEVVYQCRREKTGGAKGDYRIFSHPELRPWPRIRRPIRQVSAEKLH